MSRSSHLSVLFSLLGVASLLVSVPAIQNRARVRGPGAGKPPVKNRALEAARWNNLGAAYMNQQQFARALEEFKKAANADPKLFAAQLNQGIALVNLQRVEEARTALMRASRLDPASAAPWYNLGLLEKAAGRAPEATRWFSKAGALSAHDPEVFYFLGSARSETGEQEAAISALQTALKLNPRHVSAEFALARAYQRKNDPGEARLHLARFQELTQKKLGSPITLSYGEQGRLSLAQQVRLPVSAMPKAVPVRFEEVPAAFPDGGERRAGGESKAAACVLDIDEDGHPDVWTGDGQRVKLYRNAGDGRFADGTESSGLQRLSAASACAAGDFDNDGHTDLAIASSIAVFLFRGSGDGRFEDVTGKSLILARSGSTGVTWFDYDHDGDLDLFLGASAQEPSSLWRNNGDGTFRNAGDEKGFALAGISAVLPTDLNEDRAIDAVLLSASEPASVLTNPREGKFQPLAAFPEQAPIAASGVVFDGDKNGWMDVLLAGTGARSLGLWKNTEGKFLHERLPEWQWRRALSVATFDYDNDGWLDIAALGERSDGGQELRVLRNVGGEFRETTAELKLATLTLEDAGGLAILDFDGDGDADLLVTRAGAAPVLLRNDGGNRNHWLRLGLRGLNDNKSAIGAKLEVFAGDIWQRWEITGINGSGQSAMDALAGLGPYQTADIVRVLWPTGVLQDEIEIASNRRRDFLEIDRRGSSCPVLFAWDGERYRFVADMIGSGVFGHWVAPGELNVPDPTEYLKLERVTPALKDGRLSFRFLEPMEESVYVDQLRLLAIDHPGGVEVFPDERFLSAPPYPEFKVIASRDAVPVRHALDSKGRDVSALLQDRDRRYVADLELLPYRGFTKSHTLELDLGIPYAGGPIRLLLYGYIEYFTATGMFSAHQAGVDPSAPSVEAFVDGHWVRVIDDMGFPAGLPRTIIAELTNRLPTGAQRIRITTNLQIYWDQILIDRTGQGQAMRVSEVPLASARLGFLGYPKEMEGRSPGDITYIYEQVSKTGPYTRQSGAYTRFGDVTDLISRPDDRFAVFGSGEEVAVNFDPSKLPSIPPGWKRDYFFFADGYEKDMDFYASDFLSVEPMPFHAMNGYPGKRNLYPAERHLDYLLERNDRFGSASQRGEFRFQFEDRAHPR